MKKKDKKFTKKKDKRFSSVFTNENIQNMIALTYQIEGGLAPYSGTILDTDGGKGVVVAELSGYASFTLGIFAYYEHLKQEYNGRLPDNFLTLYAGRYSDFTSDMCDTVFLTDQPLRIQKGYEEYIGDFMRMFRKNMLMSVGPYPDRFFLPKYAVSVDPVTGAEEKVEIPYLKDLPSEWKNSNEYGMIYWHKSKDYNDDAHMGMGLLLEEVCETMFEAEDDDDDFVIPDAVVSAIGKELPITKDAYYEVEMPSEDDVGEKELSIEEMFKEHFASYCGYVMR